MDFDLALAFVLDREGGYSDHPRDPGGRTNMGITQRVALHWGFNGQLKAIPMIWVRRIYRSGYWDACRCDNLPDHPLRLVVFDAAVHSGPGQSIKWLQSELGVTVDGKLGPKTLGAVLTLSPGGLDRLALALIDRRLAFLKSLKTWRDFGRGWSSRIAALREAVMA